MFAFVLVVASRFIERRQRDSKIAAMILRSSESHEAASSPYRHVDADTPKTVISADRFLVACGTRPVRRVWVHLFLINTLGDGGFFGTKLILTP